MLMIKKWRRKKHRKMQLQQNSLPRPFDDDVEEENDNEFYNFFYLKSVPIPSHLVAVPASVCWFVAMFTLLHLLRVPYLASALEIIHIEYSARKETNTHSSFACSDASRKEKWMKLVELNETNMEQTTATNVCCVHTTHSARCIHTKLIYSFRNKLIFDFTFFRMLTNDWFSEREKNNLIERMGTESR